MAQAKQDMGSGSVKKLMLQLMIPAVVAQVVNLLYNIVDRIYIGHIAGIGAAALTGVGLFTPILMLLNAFAMLVGAGGAPRTAIALGQGDKEQAEKIISNSFTMLLLFSVVLTVVFYAGAPTLLRLFGASDATLPYALAYSRIYILGSVFVLLVLGMNPFITTQGFAKTSMLTTVIGAVINIILDPIFIFVLKWGMMGAAVATVIGQVVFQHGIDLLFGERRLCRAEDARRVQLLCQRAQHIRFPHAVIAVHANDGVGLVRNGFAQLCADSFPALPCADALCPHMKDRALIIIALSHACPS